MRIVPGASYGQAYAGSYDATSSNYAVNKRSARSLPQVSCKIGFILVFSGREQQKISSARTTVNASKLTVRCGF